MKIRRKFIENSGADVNALTYSGSHSLHLAALAGSLNCIEKINEILTDNCPVDNLHRYIIISI